MLHKTTVVIAQERAAKVELIEIDFEWRRCLSFKDINQVVTGKSLCTDLYEESYAISTRIIQKLLIIALYASAWIAWLHQNG